MGRGLVGVAGEDDGRGDGGGEVDGAVLLLHRLLRLPTLAQGQQSLDTRNRKAHGRGLEGSGVLGGRGPGRLPGLELVVGDDDGEAVDGDGERPGRVPVHALEVGRGALPVPRALRPAPR